MGKKDKIAFIIIIILNTFIFFCITFNMVNSIVNTSAPYLYYGYQKTTQENIKIVSTWGDENTFSNGDVVNDSDIPWFTTLFFILFILICGTPWIVTLILYKLLGFKLPPDPLSSKILLKTKYTTIKPNSDKQPKENRQDKE